MLSCPRCSGVMGKCLIQVFGFLISTLGWLFILCTMAMDYWRITQIGGQGGSFIIKVAWYWSNLWKDCFTDSTAVTNCKDFAVLWSVAAYVQGVRGLLMCGLGLGFFGAIFCFLGMECTYIGGKEKTKDKFVLAGSIFHFVGGMSDIAAYCLYINRIARTTFAENLERGTLRYDIGTPIFLGLVGCFLIYLGAILYAFTVYKVVIPQSNVVVYRSGTRTYMAPRSGGRTLYPGYYRPSRQNSQYYGPSRQNSQYYGQYGTYMGSGKSSSSRLSNISETTPGRTSERDAFV